MHDWHVNYEFLNVNIFLPKNYKHKQNILNVTDFKDAQISFKLVDFNLKPCDFDSYVKYCFVRHVRHIATPFVPKQFEDYIFYFSLSYPGRRATTRMVDSQYFYQH